MQSCCRIRALRDARGREERLQMMQRWRDVLGINEDELKQDAAAFVAQAEAA